MSTTKELNQTLDTWINRLRLQRALIWSLRGLVAGLAISLVFGSIGLYQARLLRDEFLLLVISISLLIPLIAGLTSYLWRIQSLDAARRFDLIFHLKERISTALELDQRPDRTPYEIIQRQLEDAISASHTVNPTRDLPLKIKIQEAVTALVLITLIGVVWLRGDNLFNAAQKARAVQQAVTEQSQKIDEIIKQVEANDKLTEEQKQAITQQLKQAQQGLKENPSLENSVSVLTSTGEKLKSLSDPQSEAMSKALQQTGQQLSKQDGSPLQSVGKDLAQGNNINAASELRNIDVSKLSESEKQQLADQLDAMAESLQSTNPQLASQLKDAAKALRKGDTAAAQQALENAAQSLAQAGQQIVFSQTANQTANQMQQGADQVLATGGGQQQANQSGQGDQSTQGQQSGQGNQSSQGQGTQGQGSQGSNQGGQTNGSGGSGSGSGSDAGSDQTGPEAGTDPIAQNNGAGDGGERSYEQIYAPKLLGGDSGTQVNLPSSNQNGGDVIGQGPTTPGAQGQSLVPYSNVYAQYDQINHQAIENGEVPTQFSQIIKNYFDSLKP